MFNVKFSGGEAFTVSFASPESFDADMTTTIEKPIGDYYEGPYEFRPGAEDQTIHINGLVATEDIVVKAVPQWYGLIIWDGNSITVR